MRPAGAIQHIIVARNLLICCSQATLTSGAYERNIMKKFAVLLLGSCLITGYAFAGEPTAADQKWLQAVEKLVADGQKKVSTPSQDRANLLKEWAAKNGYSVQVTKTDAGFSLEVSGKAAAAHIAQK
jgi:hypothetical protein